MYRDSKLKNLTDRIDKLIEAIENLREAIETWRPLPQDENKGKKP